LRGVTLTLLLIHLRQQHPSADGYLHDGARIEAREESLDSTSEERSTERSAAESTSTEAARGSSESAASK
jgi:hypothetical protein